MRTSQYRARSIKYLSGCLLLVCSGLAATKARASATVLLEMPYGKLNIFAPAGHEAIYLDRVCAATPVKLRPCGAGELGVVISRYDGITDHDWVAIPLLPYLYAVKDDSDIPQEMSKEKEIAMREAYRKQYLQLVAPDLPDGSAPEGNWYQLVGSAFDRTIYGFRVNTDAEDDAMLIAVFNDQRNVQRYNGLYRNCADFARTLINRIYPHAIHRNWVGDFGITSPKAVARSLTHYAGKHPEVGLDVFLVPQVAGTLPRSHKVTGVSEGVLKRYGVPLTVLSPELAGVALVAYVAHGRFHMPTGVQPLDIEELRASLSIAQPFPVAPPDMPRHVLPEVSVATQNSPSGAGGVETKVEVKTDIAPAVVTPGALVH
jgi:hypothetical protein